MSFLQEIDLYCVDCDRWTRQKFRGVRADHTAFYTCCECGCENSIDIKKDQEDNIKD